ncbi:winged helix DNA-binding domain-containing protein [Coprobacter tertius]|uniref:Winged helix DNA-binding domain-containing protein n=1 Tax=Coprobacter tertius TaxID=2944915 RepID=A0ABT1MFP0_9BACT|nr:winged helix DNA-binding domain-containing protein [Coprobacter tertius]MCP9611450.1 winged helix DNA-binding domain-containing protein [Coprobacter tertius]
MIATTRSFNHQFIDPRFDDPMDLVGWMGAIQAQNYSMAKWAIGSRLQSGSLNSVNEAIRKGSILRTHILRPTWHFISAEDIRWMLKLSGSRIRKAYESFARNLNISEKEYMIYNNTIIKLLEGNKSFTRQEICEELNKKGIKINDAHARYYIIRAETDGILCSGEDKNGKPSYALLDERVPVSHSFDYEEALGILAKKYFKSHSPASLEDFVWWSGLTTTDAKKAIDIIKNDLTKIHTETEDMYVYHSNNCKQTSCEYLHLLPSYDELLIGYKSRTPVLEEKHYSKAFNRFGIFYPVILLNGKIIGNWNKSVRKNKIEIDVALFDPEIKISDELLNKARHRYIDFINK